MGKRRRARLPSIYLDEHLADVKRVFVEAGFRTIEIGKTNRLKGREEAEYLPELYRENAVFVTSDREFIDGNENDRHAGIAWVPEPKEATAKHAADVIREVVGEWGIHGMRGLVALPANDGYHVVGSDGEDVFFWPWSESDGV